MNRIALASPLVGANFGFWARRSTARTDHQDDSGSALTPAPLLFSLSAGGRGQGAIWRPISGQVASPSSPAVAGEILSMYTTSLVDGGVIPPQVSIGGRLADILFFGNAPGFPGSNQVNFRVPAGVETGATVPVRLVYLARASNTVTIGVQ